MRRFVRFNLGEGIQKKSVDFAAEVAAQTTAKADVKPKTEAPKVEEPKQEDNTPKVCSFDFTRILIQYFKHFESSYKHRESSLYLYQYFERS